MMDGFNYQLNEPNEEGCADVMDNLGFINGNEGIDRVLFDAQETLLRGDIGPIGDEVDACQDTSSFLNPINDILGDINEFSKNFCYGDQVGPLTSLPCTSVVPLQGGCGNSTGSWSALHDAGGETVVNTNSYGNLPESSKRSVGGDIDNEGLFSIVNGTDATVEFSASDCAFVGGEYTSTINHWLQSMEQQQMSFMSVMPPSALPLSYGVAAVGYSDSFLNTIGSLPASTTITPIAVEDHQLQVQHQRTFSPPPQQEVTIEARFLTTEKVGGSCNSFLLPENLNLIETCGNRISQSSHGHQEEEPRLRDEEWRSLQSSAATSYCLPTLSLSAATAVTSKKLISAPQQLSQNKRASLPLPSFSTSVPRPRIPTIGFQKSHLHWTAVFPRKKCIQPPEMIVMHPLRTRKLMHTARRTVTGSTVCSDNCNVGDGDTINLSEYFDTSSINIPMIRQRSLGKNENRRKQKLNIIPGSENLIFEVQRNECNNSEEFVQIPTRGQINTEVDLYPETELPELDEIFRRKKKTTAVSTSGNKRSFPNAQSIYTGVGAVVSSQKKHSQNTTTQQPSASVQESSTSFEEKISVSIAIRKGRSNLSIDKNDLILSSESDSGESHDDKYKNKDNSFNQQMSKSLKCQKCRKLFKTTRSLAIHTKRCAAVQRDISPKQAVEQKVNDNNIVGKKNNINVEMKNPPKMTQIHPEDNENSLEISFCCSANPDGQINLKILSSVSNDENKARPITRSQTRRSTGRSIQLTNAKRSK